MATYNAEAGHIVVEVSPDIHICGFCKEQYNNFEVFLAHKQNGCSVPTSDIPVTTATPTLTDSGTEFVFEESYQTCVMRGVKKILTKAQKTPSKKLKPSLTSKRHSCCFSGCTFKTQYGEKDLERHLKTHTGEKPFECELCHKRFSRRDKLNMHSRSHTGEKPHKCKHCPYAAADSSSLKKHLRIHYDERPFKCQICPYASRNSSQLTVHLRSHTGDAPFQCQQCDAKFKINSDLKRHARIHSGEKPYKCDFCEYRCAMKGNLKSHVQIRHGTGDSFRCPACHFQCASKTALRQHSREHQPSQPIRCPACTYSCSSRGALKVHERIHSEERPFKCEFCSFASKQRSNLVIHRKKNHADRPERGGGGGGARGAGGGGGGVGVGGKGGGGGVGGGGGAVGGGDSPKPVSSRYRAKLDAARAFRCDLCDASFVREDSLRSHRKQHRDTQSATAHPHLPCAVVTLSPALTTPLTTATQLQVPLPCDPLAGYSSAQLKIIVSHPLVGQEGGPYAVDGPPGKTTTTAVLLGPDDLVVNSMIQRVGLLTPTQEEGEGGDEGEEPHPQTLLLTRLVPPPAGHDDDPLHQALLQTALASQDAGGQTFIATCSDLEGLSALIRDGGTEVTVVTEGDAPAAVVASVPCGPPTEGASERAVSVLSPRTATAVTVHRSDVSSDAGGRGVATWGGGGLLGAGQGVVIHGLPLVVSAHTGQQSVLEQLSDPPHALYSDPHAMDGLPH